MFAAKSTPAPQPTPEPEVTVDIVSQLRYAAPDPAIELLRADQDGTIDGSSNAWTNDVVVQEPPRIYIARVWSRILEWIESSRIGEQQEHDLTIATRDGLLAQVAVLEREVAADEKALDNVRTESDELKTVLTCDGSYRHPQVTRERPNLWIVATAAGSLGDAALTASALALLGLDGKSIWGAVAAFVLAIAFAGMVTGHVLRDLQLGNGKLRTSALGLLGAILVVIACLTISINALRTIGLVDTLTGSGGGMSWTPGKASNEAAEVDPALATSTFIAFTAMQVLLFVGVAFAEWKRHHPIRDRYHELGTQCTVLEASLRLKRTELENRRARATRLTSRLAGIAKSWDAHRLTLHALGSELVATYTRSFLLALGEADATVASEVRAGEEPSLEAIVKVTIGRSRSESEDEN